MTLGFGKMARYAAAGVSFCTSPVAGAIVGHYIDRYLKTDPLLTLIFCLGGFGAGVYHLTRELEDLRRES
jgi:F0F1-type ATP synthase assembly protein I